MTAALRFLPGVALAAVLVAVWGITGTPLGAAALYALAFVWSVTLPGVAVARQLRERHSLFEDLAVGTALGFVLQLLAWAVFTALGIQGALIAWPLLVLVPVIAMPATRARLGLGGYPRQMHPATAWAFVGASLIALRGMGMWMGRTHLPPAANQWYQDDYWHMALSAELMRSVPPDLPQVAGTPFFYHWFANAHVATMAHTTGIDLAVVFARLWMPFVVVAGLAMIVVLGRALTKHYWTGAIGALMAAAGAAIYPSWFSLFGTSVFSVNSPSQQFSSAIMLLTLLPLIDLARGQKVGWRGWLLLALGALGCSGAKASILPVVVCGVLLATAVALVFNRALLRGLLGALGVTLGVMIATLPLTSGGSAGVKIQLLASIRGTQPWSLMLGGIPPVSLESIPPGLERSGAPMLLLLLLVSYAVAYGWLLSGIVTLNRRDVSGWLLLGLGIAGWSAMMLLNQDGFSQVYFMSSAVIGWYLLMGVGIFGAWNAASGAVGQSRAAASAALGAVGGWFLVSVAKRLSGSRPDPTDINSSIVAGLAPVLLALAAGVAAVLVARSLGRTRLAASLWLGVVAALVGAAVPRALVQPFISEVPGGSFIVTVSLIAAAVAALVVVARPQSRSVLEAVSSALAIILGAATAWSAIAGTTAVVERPLRDSTQRSLSVAETVGARWLEANSGRDDIVATNVHCLWKTTVEFCDARAFWLGAFAERRVFLEGWAYTSEAHQAHGVNNRRYANQPFHDAERFDLNEAAFANPTADVLQDLRAEGVDWLFADSAASEIAPELDELAEVVFREGTVTIYRLG